MKQFVLSNDIINKDATSLNRYFNEVKKINLLSREQEVLIAQKANQGDLEALHTLVKSNLRFVISVAKRYQNRGISIADLINEGNVGLMVAARHYDTARGFKFISYAVWWIRQAMITAIAEQSRLIHIPYNFHALMVKVKGAESQLEQNLKRKPTIEEIADDLHISIRKLHELIFFSDNEVSLDRIENNNSNTTLLDLIPSNDSKADYNLCCDSTKQLINSALKVLNARQKAIIELYFGLNLDSPLRIEEIAKKFELSVEHTRRLKDQALSRIRSSSYSASLYTAVN